MAPPTTQHQDCIHEPTLIYVLYPVPLRTAKTTSQVCLSNYL